MKPIVKHDGGHIMIQWDTSFNTVGEMVFIEGNITSKWYIGIFWDNLLKSV